jgi:hypothetical protein
MRACDTRFLAPVVRGRAGGCGVWCGAVIEFLDVFFPISIDPAAELSFLPNDFDIGRLAHVERVHLHLHPYRPTYHSAANQRHGGFVCIVGNDVEADGAAHTAPFKPVETLLCADISGTLVW